MGGAEKGETMVGMLNKIKKKINTGKMWGEKRSSDTGIFHTRNLEAR